MKRGELYWANLAPRSGSEQQGRRPVLVISHDGFNSVPTWRSVIVVPLSTSDVQKKRGLTSVLLPKGSGGLTSHSVALCHQVTTLDRSKLERRIGKLGTDLMRSVEAGILVALDLQL